MSLLTPLTTVESHPFDHHHHHHHHYNQSYYHPMDTSADNNHHQLAQEWTMYSSSSAPDYAPDVPNGREALAKATKDLMSLDADRWPQGYPDQSNYHYYSQQQQEQPRYSANGAYDQPHRFPLPQQQPQQRRSVTFPFLSNRDAARRPSPSGHPHNPHVPQPISIAPLNTLGSDLRNSNFLSTPTTSSSSSTTTSFSFSTGSSRSINGTPTLPSPISPPPSLFRGSLSPGLSNGTKRRSLDSNMGLPAPKRSRASPPYPSPSSRPSTSDLSQSTVTSNKPALLSASQKKANHIQSEQKRRANIRRGYEALCETVPALREAIRAEEEEEREREREGKGSHKSKRSKKAKNGDEGDKDKQDGRAGPKSENVVLVKTIDYITSLQSERSELLGRLERARESLAPGHPALLPSIEPLWEREWKGGEAVNAEEDEEDEEQ